MLVVRHLGLRKQEDIFVLRNRIRVGLATKNILALVACVEGSTLWGRSYTSEIRKWIEQLGYMLHQANKRGRVVELQQTRVIGDAKNQDNRYNCWSQHRTVGMRTDKRYEWLSIEQCNNLLGRVM